MTAYIRLSQDKRYGLKKNGELWRIEKRPYMVGSLSDSENFDEAVEQDRARIDALMPLPPEEPEEEIL